MKLQILIIGNHLPEPKSSAAGRKMMQWLEMFRQNEDEVVYASVMQPTHFSEEISDWIKRWLPIQLNDDSFQQQVKEIHPDIVIYDEFTLEEQFGWRVREVVNNAIHILETQDLHFLRDARRKKKDIHSELAKRELASILRCDLTSIISSLEVNFLKENFPFVSPQIIYFPLCYPVLKQEFTDNSLRKDFCFIGNYHHLPNRDAVLLLRQKWKEIRKELPHVKIFIYGAYPDATILNLHSEKDGFIVRGRAESVAEIFAKHRILLAPLQFGAGLKGKLLEAMQHGILSVTTPVGCEGIGTENYWNGKVGDVENFVRNAVDCYRLDETSYQNFQQIGVNILQANFDEKHFNQTIYETISTVASRLNEWRNQHFLSEILNHHRQQSVRYLSKWIAAKNK